MKEVIRRRMAPVARRVPGGDRAIAAVRLRRALRRIERSGVFDQAWYELSCARSFPSARAAMTDYLQRGRVAGLSPSPLFEPEWYDTQRWRTRRGDPLTMYLGRPYHLKTRSPSAAFDPQPYVEEDLEVVHEPGGPMGHFLATATPDSALHLVDVLGTGAVRAWGEVRPQLERTVRGWLDQERLRTAPRHTSHFDAAAARAFEAGLHGVDPVAPADGTPLVTVVMPAWNRARLLRRAVESVQAQTLASWELIVVDDGSTDDTAAVLEGLSTFEPRLQVLHQDRGGVCAARNLAIARARGQFVAFLDSDNTWEPEFLRLMVAAMQRGGLEAAYSAMELRHKDRVTYRAFGGGREFLLVGNHIDLNVLVVRAPALVAVGGFTPDLRRAVDYDLVLKLSERTQLHYLPFIGAIYTEDGADGDRISVREPISWDYLVRARHTIDWVDAAAGERVPGRLSVVVPVRDDAKLARRCIVALLNGAGEADVEVLLLDRASRRSQSVSMATFALADERVRVRRTPVDLGHPYSVDVAITHTTGELIVVCDVQTVVGPGWADALAQGLRADDVVAVQPVATGRQGTVVGAGATFTAGGALPTELLAGHPPEDARALGASVAIPALNGPVWAARASDLIAAQGLDCLFTVAWQETDLALRLTRDGRRCLLLTGTEVMHLPLPDAAAVPRSSTADDQLFRQRWGHSVARQGAELWEGCGLTIAHHRLERTESAGDRRLRPVVVRRARLVVDGPAAGRPALRWAIKIAAPVGPRGRQWGDWHFAQSLAGSLRRLGQDVVVDLREAHYRDSAYLDDVNLVLRGLDSVDPDEARVNLMWVISHPESVQRTEMAEYDRVMAASVSWSRATTQATGIPVEPLLQCTDSALFHPGAAPPDSGAPVLFVGGSRGVYRSAVRFAVEAGADLRVYGGGWEPFLLEDSSATVVAEHLANADVPAAYAAAGVVLNDHWDDMRLEGFISNRAFDVAAVAGRLASDHVAGIEDVLGGVVRTWTAPTELAALVLGDPDEVFPDREERLKVAAYVRAEHSFDARARRLLEVALECRRS